MSLYGENRLHISAIKQGLAKKGNARESSNRFSDTQQEQPFSFLCKNSNVFRYTLHAVVRRWSSEAPAVVLRGYGCGRGGASSFSSFSSLLLFFFSLFTWILFVKNEGSIYRFSEVA
ncbi:hypothetical protein MA16_Dca027354 [Dendrobium catenatum]|uniref:Uncharacterized protein n=1 Tax=Dendrobium catenatum TaxID=906689 RepID=A0A2I0VDL5_9ASPA|nr:hypothetical protein MA16_Dca027354 [Dendrobium catenatum]